LTVVLLPKRISSLASCTTSSLFYVITVKELFPCLSAPVSERKRMQRYDYFPKQQIFYRYFFKKQQKKCRVLIFVKTRHAVHLIILYTYSAGA